ncbi:hypothetical protein VZT92_023168 [Zoarces viviparus]|uniref:Uncharacterized protein n=1 Tax=Zoarces viviparus TaxID=48416 RepID=A0AAW1E6T3_ZOAVI
MKLRPVKESGGFAVTLNSSAFVLMLLEGLRDRSRLHAATDLQLISTSNQGTQPVLSQTAALHRYQRLGLYEVKELQTAGKEGETGNEREIKRKGNHTVLVFCYAL